MHHYIEDARKGTPIDAAKVLDDQQLEAGGLNPVKAWVRTNQSKNALRLQRHREKLAEEGVKQINIKAPEAVHQQLKTIATAAREGRDWQAEMVGAELAAVQRTLAAGGWRARMISWLSR